ncbi:unnamed protein product [Discula destructiva]
MAPQIGGSGAFHQARDGDGGESSDNAVFIFFSLVGLCVVIMAPMLFLMWLMMGNKKRNDTTTQTASARRAREWRRATGVQPQQQQQQHEEQHGAQQPTMVVDPEAHPQAGHPVDNIQVPRRAKLSSIMLPKLRMIAISSQQAVAIKSQLLWQRLTQPLTARRQSRLSRSRTGVSIDLPIMRQPAWQKLASGSADGSGVTPSITLANVSKPTASEVDVTDRIPAGLVVGDGAKQVNEVGGEAQLKRQDAVVGLALG